MTGREIVRGIVAGRPVPRTGFWLGNPLPETWPLLHAYFGTRDEEDLRRRLGDDFRWITPQYRPSGYRDPRGRGLFDASEFKRFHGEAGPLAGAESTSEVEAFDWPNPDYLDFAECLAELDACGPYYRASGFWAPFFHNVMDLLGMESYFIKMQTHPEVVEAVTARVCGFYLEANRRFFAAAGDRMDGYFFGNDFGTQIDCLISPSHFDAFILPWFRRLTDQAHAAGHQVILHSCGSIYRVIPRLIEAGVECLHPLQARAGRMEAERLAAEFGGKIAFLGGVDTQDLLVNGTPAAVKAEVRRLRGLFGPRWICSPSHEALLPNVPPANVAAMAEAARD